MSAPLEKTKTPGIYKRGNHYAFIYRVDGRQKWESARTLDEARLLKQARQTDVARGELEHRLGGVAEEPPTLHEYAREWVDRSLPGQRSPRIPEETRAEYRGLLEDALQHFAASATLGEVTSLAVAQLVGWLVKQPNHCLTSRCATS